jgi:hypothetical protein
LGDPTSSYATAGIALRVTEAHKLPHHVKVETPLGELQELTSLKMGNRPHFRGEKRPARGTAAHPT